MEAVSGDNVKKEEKICMFPECKSGKALYQIHDLINTTMTESNQNGKEMVELLKGHGELLAKAGIATTEILNVKALVSEFKDDQKKINDNLFDLLRKKVSKQEIVWGIGILSAIATGVYMLVK